MISRCQAGIHQCVKQGRALRKCAGVQQIHAQKKCIKLKIIGDAGAGLWHSSYMSNTNTANTAEVTEVTEEQLDSLLREFQEADASVLDARLWASPGYVAEKKEAAEKAWVAYRKASEKNHVHFWAFLLK